MVYHMSGGNTDYDPSLGGLPSTTFQEMDGDFSKVFIVDPTRDGGGGFLADHATLAARLLLMAIFQRS